MERMKKVRMIPTPKRVSESGGRFPYKTELCLLHREFEEAAEVFADYARRLGLHFTISENAPIQIIRDAALGPEEYRLSAGNGKVKLFASDLVGANHAFASLLQLFEPDAVSPELVWIPDCEISDAPDCAYRGMMVDLARNWHDFSYLLSYVDFCYFYKISVLHLHFTDDQSYTLPSALFPALSTKGRCYTEGQIAELNRYAAARGVQLMPEIDVPGHCVSFQKEYPELFGTDGIICQTPQSIEAMQALFRELCEMFSASKYIHIGGDVAQIENWLKCPRCAEYAQDAGIDVRGEDQKLAAEKLYASFVMKMAEPVLAAGKIPVAWEGFCEQVNDLVSREILIMSWENYYQVTPALIRAGFRIINCSWNPMYIVTPEPAWPPREIYDWSIYKWKAVHPGSPYLGKELEIPPTRQVLGGQLLAWGDRIAASYPTVEEGVAAERRLLLERLPFLAENTWNRDKTISWEALSETAAELGARLEGLY